MTSVSGDAVVRVTKIATSGVGGAEQTTVDGTLVNYSSAWRTYIVTLRPSAGLMSSVTVNTVGPLQTAVWEGRFPGRVSASIAAISAAAAVPTPELTTATVRLTMSRVAAYCPVGACPTRQVTGTMYNPGRVQHQIIAVNLLASDGTTVTGAVHNLAPGQTASWRAAFNSNVDAAHLAVTPLRIEAVM